MQQNSKSRLYENRDETVNGIISEYCKLAQKEYKTVHDWVGKVIHWELCKRLKFGLTIKKNPPKKMRRLKIFLGFEIQTNYLIPDRDLDLVLLNKKKNLSSGWICCVLVV